MIVPALVSALLASSPKAEAAAPTQKRESGGAIESPALLRIMEDGRPFTVTPYDYSVIDGDTLKVRLKEPDADGNREAFRIRFSAVNAPEIGKPQITDAALRHAGIQPNPESPGTRAREFMRELLKGRAIFVDPARDEDGHMMTDRFGRLLANVVASGKPGANFRTGGMIPAQHALYEAGLCELTGQDGLPAATPPALETIINRKNRDSSMNGPSI